MKRTNTKKTKLDIEAEKIKGILEAKGKPGTGRWSFFHLIINGAHQFPGCNMETFAMDYKVQLKSEDLRYAVKEAAEMVSSIAEQIAQIAKSVPGEPVSQTGQAVTEAPLRLLLSINRSAPGARERDSRTTTN
jgi:hypothetical protein